MSPHRTLLALAALAAGGPAAARAAQPAPLPDALVGIWKGVDVPAEFRNTRTGAGIALSAWSGQLKLRGDGRYELEEYREGELGGCRVSILQRSTGTARADGTMLTLVPSGGAETKRDGCDRAASYSDRRFAPRGERFTIALSWVETLSGWMTLRLALTAHDRDGESYALQAVHNAGPDWPGIQLTVEPRPDAVPAQLAARWRWPADARAEFFSPATGALTPPRGDAHWLRLEPGGRYEWAGWIEDLVPGPGCRRSVLVYERGRFALTVGQYEWQNALTTYPEGGLVIERVSDCGADDEERRRDLPLTPSQYRWGLGRTVDGDEVLELRCASEVPQRSEWQFALCHWGFEFRTLLARAP